MNIANIVSLLPSFGFWRMHPKAVILPNATGNETQDTANILAALTKAGAGGMIMAPPNQIYVVNGKGGFLGKSIDTAVPSRFDLNGSTIKLTDNLISSTITGTFTAGAHKQIVVANGDGAKFTAGDNFVLREPNYSAWTTGFIESVAGDTLTCTLGTFNIGTQVTTGSVLMREDACLYFAPSTPVANVKVVNGVYDGNGAVRKTKTGYTSVWADAALLSVHNCLYSEISGNVFQHSAHGFGLDMDDNVYSKINSNHFTDIISSGATSGGSGVAMYLEYIGNTFDNVYQLTDSTVPTVTQHAHYPTCGAIANSNGPAKCLVNSNIVSSCGAFGFASINSGDTEWIVNGNIFRNCVMGGFQVASGGQYGVVTNNLIEASGHSTGYGNQSEITGIIQSPASLIDVSGNLFVDSVFYVSGDSGQFTFTNNLCTFLNKTQPAARNAVECAAVTFLQQSTGPTQLHVSNNMLIGPSNGTKALDGIRCSHLNYANISDNVIYGGWIGISIDGYDMSYSKVCGNIISNQCETTETVTWAYGIAFLYGTGTKRALQIHDNIVSNTVATNKVWVGIGFDATTVCDGVTLKHNTVLCKMTPVTAAVGMRAASGQAGAGLTIESNHIAMNTAGQAAVDMPSLTSGCLFVANRVPTGTVNANTATKYYGSSANYANGSSADLNTYT